MGERREWKPDWAVAPGEIVSETLEERGWSQSRLAVELGVTPPYVSGIVRGRRAITAHVALGLERVLGISAGLLVNLQANYDLAVARAATSTEQRESPK